MQSRQVLAQGLSDLGFEVIPSHANFVFTRHPRFAGALLAKALRDQHILVRHFAIPRIDQYLRITVGTENEIRRLLDGLTRIILSANPSA